MTKQLTLGALALGLVLTTAYYVVMTPMMPTSSERRRHAARIAHCGM